MIRYVTWFSPTEFVAPEEFESGEGIFSTETNYATFHKLYAKINIPGIQDSPEATFSVGAVVVVFVTGVVAVA